MRGVCQPQKGAKVQLEQKSGSLADTAPWLSHNAQINSTKCMK